MNNDVLSRLVEEIKSSPEFLRLKQAKAVISKNPTIKKELEEYSQSQRQLFSGKLPTKDAEGRAKQLDTKFENLSKIPEVKNYLNAIGALNQIMLKINFDINERLEKELK